MKRLAEVHSFDRYYWTGNYRKGKSQTFCITSFFSEYGQLQIRIRAPRGFRHLGKPNYSKMVENMLMCKEQIELVSEKKPTVVK
jgi:hypothetical protein